MSESELKQHVNSSEDFYALLDLESSATEAEIRRAYRQTARKYHPDKVGASNTAAVEKFHLLQIAYGVLSDDTLKELYDNTRRAREEQKARQSAFTDRRKAMVEELERREAGGFKRKHDELAEEEKQEMELRRLAADGKRRREELQDRIRRDQLREDALSRQEHVHKQEQQSSAEPKLNELDRAVTFSYLKDEKTDRWDKEYLHSIFARFGVVDAVVLKEKRLKPPGSKHRQDYYTATVVFNTLVGAHAAVSDFPKVQADSLELAPIENVAWAVGKAEPTGNGTKVNPDLEQKTPNTVHNELPRKVPKFSFNPKLAGK